MRIAILGSGAMGSLFGGRLASAGANVVLYDVYREHVEAVRSGGLAIEDAGGHPVLTAHPQASGDPAACRDADVYVVFVKATATEEIARTFASIAGARAIVLTLQNGLGNEAILRTHFGDARTAAGVTSQGATFLSPGRIRHAGAGPTHLGMSSGTNERLAAFAGLLNAAGMETHLSDDVASHIWSKLVINVGINALTALLAQPNGRLLEQEDTRALLSDLVAEAVAVARARGVRLAYEDPLARVLEVAERTGANRSSMLQDFDRGRLSEIEFINGAILREARAAGIPAPVNTTVTRLVLALERFRGSRG
jgi:2-dehydropantoate 2-reductase